MKQNSSKTKTANKFLLAFDLDGTLTTREGVLLTCLGNTIKELQYKGHVIAILTGNTLSTTHEFLKSTEIDTYYATNHGASLYSPQHHLLYFNPINDKVVNRFLTLNLLANQHLHFVSQQNLYSSRLGTATENTSKDS